MMPAKIETTVVKVGNSVLWREPDEKAIERKIAEMASEGWILIQRTDYNGATRFDAHTRLTFQRYVR